MGEIIWDSMALVPIVVNLHVWIGNLFEQLLYDTGALPSQEFSDTRTQAAAANRVTRSHKVPRVVFEQANTILRRKNPEVFYGDSYKAMDPWICFDQKLGLLISTALFLYIIRAHNKSKTKPQVSTMYGR